MALPTGTALDMMLSARFARIGVVGLVLGICGLAASYAPTPALATGSGPALAVANARLVNGQVLVNVNVLFSVVDAYDGFEAHLRWDPAVFSFASMDPTGGLFDPNANPATGFCAGPDTTHFDSDGGGVAFGCAGYAATTASYHLLMTVALTPAASGCSAIHLVTYGGTDGGDEASGTYTENAADDTPQTNRYYDTTSDVNGNACSPPSSPTMGSPSAPVGTAAGSPGNCVYDPKGKGKIVLADLVLGAYAFNSTPGDWNWNSAVDYDADDQVRLDDLVAAAGQFNDVVTGCVPAYPYYPPDTWDGTLPANSYTPDPYAFTFYYLNTGAMKYVGGTPPCDWEFDTIVGTGYLNTCTATNDLESLADRLHADHPSFWTAVLIGPNDCTDTGETNASISSIAGKLASVLQTVNSYSNSRGDGVVFAATVDDEAYYWSYDTDRNPHVWDCRKTNVAYQTPNTDELFRDYVRIAKTDGYISTSIGPAGAPPYEFNQQLEFANDGGGSSLPQIYTGQASVTLDAYGNQTGGAWPVTMPNGYVGIQSYPYPYGYWTSWEANIRWNLYHQGPPGVDVDWSCAGGRC